MPLPPLSEQRAIARVLRTVDKKLQAEEARKQALEALFKSLLNNLMTGKIRVKDVVLLMLEKGKGCHSLMLGVIKKLTGRDY